MVVGYDNEGKIMKLNKDWKFEESFPKISAYVTAYNCVKNGYPITEAIKSFAWCDEVVVVDGGSDDETKQAIEDLQLENVVVYDIPIDWDLPGKDGQLKSMARAMCMNEVLIQFDADEICVGSREKWRRLAKDLQFDILELPVLEPLGDIKHLRLNKEHNPLKWRMTKSKPEIVHGIPKRDQVEHDGKVYSRGGSDGCNFVHVVTGMPIASYVSKLGMEYGRSYRSLAADPSNSDAATGHKVLVEGMVTAGEPCVLHVGHVDLEKKIRLFLAEWRNWWADLYNKDPEDIGMYFEDKKVEDVSDEDVAKRAEEIFKETPTLEIELLEGVASAEGYSV